MREYGKIKTAFWSSPKVRALSDDAKLLFTYLVACPHGNTIGCFVLPLGYVTEDLNWTAPKASERLRDLVSNRFIEYDPDARVVRIISWWEHNRIENGNVALSATNAAENLPTCRVLDNAIQDILALDCRFMNEFRSRLESVMTPSPDLFGNNEPLKEPENILAKKRRPKPDTFEADFADWWRRVPNKEKKAYAAECYDKARRSGASAETLLAGAEKWHTKASAESGSFTPYSKLHPSTFLNDRRWEDEDCPLPSAATDARKKYGWPVN